MEVVNDMCNLGCFSANIWYMLLLPTCNNNITFLPITFLFVLLTFSDGARGLILVKTHPTKRKASFPFGDLGIQLRTSQLSKRDIWLYVNHAILRNEA